MMEKQVFFQKKLNLRYCNVEYTKACIQITLQVYLDTGFLGKHVTLI